LLSSKIQERSRRRIVITFNRVREMREPAMVDFETANTMMTPSPKSSINLKQDKNTTEIPISPDGQTVVLDRGLFDTHFKGYHFLLFVLVNSNFFMDIFFVFLFLQFMW
jgi:hypothetical protein